MRNSKGQFVKGHVRPQKWIDQHVTAITGNKWNVGKKQPIELIEKRVAKLIGRKNTEEIKLRISEAKKGRPNGLLGTKRPSEVGQKISRALKGRLQPWNSGEKHYAWKGGVTPIHNKLRNSIEYRLSCADSKERDHYTCQMPECGKQGGELHSHHIKPFSSNPNLRHEITNLITLCKECHKKVNRNEEKYEELFNNINKLKN